MRYNVRFARSDVKGRPQDVVVNKSENTKSSVTIQFSMICVIRPDEPVWSDFHAFSTPSPQVIHRVLHRAFRVDSSEYPPIFHTFCTCFSSSIAMHIPWTISAAFSHGFRRENGRKPGGDPNSAEIAENHFRKAGSAGIDYAPGEKCTQIVARGTFVKVNPARRRRISGYTARQMPTCATRAKSCPCNRRSCVFAQD